MDGTWTISELAERAAAALAADGSAQVSGRVRDLPNERLIRWYTTIGLVDPPLGRRGRTALYGPRHLLQLIAIKRRQAAGRSIAEIQLELAAATDATLERIAALPFPTPRPTPTPNPTPAHPTTPTNEAPRPCEAAPEAEAAADEAAADEASTTDAAGTVDGADTASAAGTVDGAGTASGAGTAGTGGTVDGGASPGERAGPVEWAAKAEAASPLDMRSETARATFWNTRPDVSYNAATITDDYGRPDDHGRAGDHGRLGGGAGSDGDAELRPSVVQGVRLTAGLTLLLDVPALSGDDLAAIETAAGPLLDELRRRGLLAPAASPAFQSADPSRRSK